MKPNAVVLNGDIMDNATISAHHRIGYADSPTVKEELDEVQARLAEIEAVAKRIAKVRTAGVSLQEIGLIVRSEAEIERAVKAAEMASAAFQILDGRVSVGQDQLSICNMPIAKGLEFRAVVVMACDDDVIPSQERISEITDGVDLEEVYATERHLLYVAITRARDYLLVSCGGSRSEFLDDFRG